MAEFEGLVTINRDPAKPTANGSKGFAAAASGTKATAEQIKARRRQIHDQARQEASGAPIAPEPEPVEAPPVREDLESIEFTAPNGLTIVYGPRADISLIDRIARIYSGREHSNTEFRITRVLMGVRSVDGMAPTTIVDEITRAKLANAIGDEAIDLLLYFDRVNWPPLLQSELPVLKKRLRT